MIGPAAALWLAVGASGLYHGANPGMGWPLAAAAALMEQRPRALWRALAALGAGHLLAMLAILLPFAAMTLLFAWQREIRLLAGFVVIALGMWILLARRHPRVLARVKPTRLMLWSFLVALAHGAALMLVPIYLGLCRAAPADAGHRAAEALASHDLATALMVALVHTAAMVLAGSALAWGVYRWLGLTFLTKVWFDLDRAWASSLVLVGAIALASA